MSIKMKPIMENWRSYLVEDIQESPLLENYAHITGVLGIPLPLNESGEPLPLTEELKKEILKEQLLFEGFWDEVVAPIAGSVKKKIIDTAQGIQKYGKGWEIIKALFMVSQDSSKIDKFVDALYNKTIKKIVYKIRSFLVALSAKLAELGLETFGQMASKSMEIFDNLLDSVTNLKGWKLAIGVAGLSIGLIWVWNKIGSFASEVEEKIASLTSVATDVASDAMKSFMQWIETNMKNKFINYLQSEFPQIMAKMAGITTGIGPWWDTVVKIAGGIELVISAIGPAAHAFLRHDRGIKLKEQYTGDLILCQH